MKKKHNNVAYVLGESINALGVIKALGRNGIPVILIHNSKDTITRISRYAKSFHSPDPVGDTESYINFLIDKQKFYEKTGVLLPTSDVTVAAVSRYREQLKNRFRFVLPPVEIIEQVTSKEGFYQLAQKHNLPVPKTFSIKSLDDFEEIIDKINFPCAMKPYYSHTWRTAYFRENFGRFQILKVETREELFEKYKTFIDYEPRIVVQEFINGRDDYEYSLHTYTSRDGKNMINFLAHKLRLDPIHCGSGAFVQTAHQPEIFHTGNEFLKALNYRGMSSFQFKWDPVRRKFFAIELNPRYSLWNFLEPSCGVNYPFVNYLDSLGDKFEIPDDYKDGVKWFSIERDINAFLSYKREGSLTFWKWIGSYRGEKFCAEFSWDDPVPFFLWLMKKAQSVARRLMKKISRGVGLN